MKYNAKISFFLKAFIGLSMIFSLSFMPAMPALALTAAQYQAQLDYQKRLAEQARQQAALKQQQAQQIQQQITAVTENISSTENAISRTEGQISTTEKSIADLEIAIKTEEDNLVKEQDRMGQVISSWYMEGETGLLEAMIDSQNISDVITQQQYYESIRQQIKGAMDKIEEIKADLGNQKTEQQNNLAALSDLKKTQNEQKSYLEDKKTLKNHLLSDTNGAISSLNAQAAEAEAKAAELRKVIASIYTSGAGGGPRGTQLITDPDFSWYYSQIDSQWSGTYLSPSRMTIGEVGCLVTSYAMVATYYGTTSSPVDIVRKSSFTTGGSWLWFNSDPGFSVNGSVPKDWGIINTELANGRPVIVSVKVPGPVYNADGSNHFIVISGLSNGKYLIHDPYWRNSSYDLANVISMKLTRN
jgi:peptidoglycan hydrolase CwlO-like protein